MTHLSPEQFVDAAEGRVHPPHLDECTACRSDVAALRETTTLVSSVPVPEPSPLFWGHFSRRVRAAVESEPAPGTAGWRRFLGDAWRPMTFLGLAAAVLTLVVVLRPNGRPAPMPVTSTANAVIGVSPVAEAASTTATSEDPHFGVVAALAQDLETEDLQQAMRPSRDAAGAALEDLTPAQCAELMRLIKTQMIGSE